MIEIREALAAISKHAPEPQAVLLASEAAHGMVLAQDIRAREDSPRFDNSAMDGYCLQWQDVEHLATSGEAAPVELHVIGESRAGRPFDGVVQRGTAVRISTGATIPRGGDTVVPQEDCQVPGTEAGGQNHDLVQICTVKKCGANIRRQGEEFRAADGLLRAGSPIDAARLGVLAGQGYATVAVWRQLRVAAIVTGSELHPHWQPGELPAGGLRDSNGPMLQALIKESSAVALPRTLAVDSAVEHREAIKAALEQNADVIVFSGGVSVGPHDLVRACAAEAGFKEVFWRVNQKPGKPLLFAVRGEQLLFGLPGNPVSAHVCFSVYVQPLLRRAAGVAQPVAQYLPAGEELVNKGRRPQFLRVAVREEAGEARVFAARRQGSHMLSGISHSAGLVLLQGGEGLAEGSSVQVQKI